MLEHILHKIKLLNGMANKLGTTLYWRLKNILKELLLILKIKRIIYEQSFDEYKMDFPFNQNILFWWWKYNTISIKR